MSTHPEREAAATRQPPVGLADLIAPTTTDTFFAEYWEKKPLLIHRKTPEYYAGVLTLADVDAMLATSSLNDGDLRLVAEGEETPVSQLVPESTEGRINGLEALYARYRSGATINLMFVNERWPALNTLCRKLAGELSAGIHGNVYLTPPGTRGLTPHHDTHDVFVCQVYGTKHWTLYPTQTPLPVQTQGYVLPETGAGEPEADFVLSPGDFLYMPRGTVHAAEANDAASVHLTVGISPMTWANALRAAIDDVFMDDVRFREGLPPGFITDPAARDRAVAELSVRLADLIGQVRPESVVDRRAATMLQRRQPTLEGHLLDLEALPSVDLSTPVRRRPQLQWLLHRKGDEIALEFHGKMINLPGYVEDEVAFMAKADEFAGAEIPGSLDEPGRLVLVRRLLQEGFLTTS
ncbi:cupin domain-containing protein [Amycolatopsis sp. NPDC026612]|uniref:cupin domain-containing protein n=1 Tax=Amycolatopsis sp. NPDC026612 TaxID=3155466 RepID=UPI0033E6AC71